MRKLESRGYLQRRPHDRSWSHSHSASVWQTDGQPDDLLLVVQRSA